MDFVDLSSNQMIFFPEEHVKNFNGLSINSYLLSVILNTDDFIDSHSLFM